VSKLMKTTKGEWYTVEALIAKGYLVVSRRWNAVSRIDRPDWKEYMASQHPRGMEWVNILGEQSAETHYRRVYSKDTIEFEENYGHILIKGVPKSNDRVTGYIDISK